MREGDVIRIGGEHYLLKYRDPGVLRFEDGGLWRADKVRWNKDRWEFFDDDDYLITDDRRVVAREIGWDLRKEEVK